MNLLFKGTVVLLSVLAMTGAASAHTTASSFVNPNANYAVSDAGVVSKPQHFQAYYYFYVEPGDTYNDYNTASGEEWEWLLVYGVIVDQTSGGGTLIAEGYYDNTYPHDLWAGIFLYAHF